MNAAKQEAAKTGLPFKEVLRSGQVAGKYPQTPEVAPEFLTLQAKKTALIKQHVLGEMQADALRLSLEQAGKEEAEFYRGQGKLDELLTLNGL